MYVAYVSAVIFALSFKFQFPYIFAQFNCECGVSNKGLATRIVGGTVTEPHAYPWIVAIFNNGFLHCGGALLTNMHVLSAGHCFKWDDYANMNVSVGLHDVKDRWKVTTRSIVDLKIHEHFTSTSVRDDNDIAIATLSEPIVFNERMLPICLPPPGSDYGGKMSVIAGWGKQGTRRGGSKQLTEATVKVLQNDGCEQSKLASHLTHSMMCAFSKGKDGCQGDSGGPLAFETAPGKFIQIGIVSWGIGCANPRFPGIYTNVTQYIDWIRLNTQEGQTCKY